MKLLLLLAVLVLLGFAAVVLQRGRKDSTKTRGAILKKNVLTNREQGMYFRLHEALEGRIVLAQVAFSALLKTSSRQDRNRFDRKVADFVICNKTFEVLAIIELDDASHKNREAQDRERELLLTDAGYRVIRYRNVPDIDILKNDLSESSVVAAIETGMRLK